MSDSFRPPAAHILSFARTLKGGGVERSMLRLARGWIEAGRRVTLVIGDASGPLAAEIPAGATVELVDSPSLLKLMSVLPGKIRTHSPDLVFCPGSWATSTAAVARLRLNGQTPPIVGKISNALDRSDLGPFVNWGNGYWQRFHPHFLDHIVAMTRAETAREIVATNNAADRISVIANAPSRAEPDAQPPVLPNRPFILGLGRLEPQKRWDRLIDALPQIARSDVGLLILGEGSLRPALEARVRALDLHERVVLAGHSGNVFPAIAAAQVVALTSEFEGVPAALREALEAGTPVVSTDSSVAIAEIIDSPARGTIVPLEDRAALVRALDHWLEPGRARPAPVPQPGLTSIADYLALFDRIVARRRKSPATAATFAPPPLVAQPVLSAGDN